MKALIFNDTLVQVEAEEFPVSPEMQWIDVADDVTTQTHQYSGGKVESIPKAIPVLAPLSPAQIRLVLDQFSLLDKWIAYVATGSKQLQIEWEFRLSFERNNPMLNAEAKKMGWTDEQVDEMFTVGATL